MNEHITAHTCLDCHRLELGSYSAVDQGFHFHCGKTSKRRQSSVGKMLPSTDQHIFSAVLEQ